MARLVARSLQSQRRRSARSHQCIVGCRPRSFSKHPARSPRASLDATRPPRGSMRGLGDIRTTAGNACRAGLHRFVAPIPSRRRPLRVRRLRPVPDPTPLPDPHPHGLGPRSGAPRVARTGLPLLRPVHEPGARAPGHPAAAHDATTPAPSGAGPGHSPGSGESMGGRRRRCDRRPRLRGRGRPFDGTGVGPSGHSGASSRPSRRLQARERTPVLGVPRRRHRHTGDRASGDHGCGRAPGRRARRVRAGHPGRGAQPETIGQKQSPERKKGIQDSIDWIMKNCP